MYKQIASNVRLTWFLIITFVIFILLIGFIFSEIYNNYLILVIAFVIAFFQSFISFYYSDKIALSTTGSVRADKTQFKELNNLVENLAITAGVEAPSVYVMHDPTINAFATGRDTEHSSISVTTGALEKLSKSELEGVLSHELSHIKNYDIRVMSLVVVLVGLIALVSDWALRMQFFSSDEDRNSYGYLILIGIILWILAPISATLIQLAISRKREYLADASGALLTRYPEGLASALEKISQDKPSKRLNNRATAHLFISDPAKADKKKTESSLAVLFSTHPSVQDRIKRLRSMA